jgi:hypothetical protein
VRKWDQRYLWQSDSFEGKGELRKTEKKIDRSCFWLELCRRLAYEQEGDVNGDKKERERKEKEM